MRNIFFIKAILCMALFFGYSNIWGQYDESYKASKLAESEKKAAERAAARVSKESTTSQPAARPSKQPTVTLKEEGQGKLGGSEEQYARAMEKQAAERRAELSRPKPSKPESQVDAQVRQELTAGEAPLRESYSQNVRAIQAKLKGTLETKQASDAELRQARTMEDTAGLKEQTEATLKEGETSAQRAATEAIAKSRITIPATERMGEGDFAARKRELEAAIAKPLEGKAAEYEARAKAAEKDRTKSIRDSQEPVRLFPRAQPTSEAQRDAVQTLAQPPKEATPPKQAQSFLQKNKKLLIAGGGIGVGLLALAGILGAILGTQSDDKDSTTTPDVTPITPITPPTPPVIPDIKPDEGIVPPSPYPDAKDEDKDDKDNKEVVDSVVSFYTDIEERFKKALETSSYFDKVFKIEGEATSGETTSGESIKTKILIEYDFTKEGAGELGTPFTPFVVKMLPQGINGIAINPDDIKTLMQDGPAKELFATLLQPNSTFVFMIKIILLINTTLNDTSKKDVEKINFIIDEATKLCSRLVITQQQELTPESVVSGLPKIFQQIINNMSLKMYGDLVDNVDDPEDTVLIKRIGELQKKRDYNQIKAFMKKQIVPLVKGNLTHTEKQHLLYTLQEQLAEYPKTERQLWEHLDYLNSILTQINKSLAKTDKETVSKIKDIIKKIQDVKAGKKTVTILTKRPELEISTAVYGKKVALKTVLKILFKNFSRIYYTKFEGDKGFTTDNFILGKQATKYKLQAIFFRCLDESLQANQTLLDAKGNVTIRKSSIKKQTINPDKEFDKICNESSLKFVQTQTILKDSMLKLKANPTDAGLQESYNAAITEVKNAANELLEDQIKFRRTFAVYLPMKQDDKSTQTPAELVQKRLNALRKNSKHVDSIIASEYAPFKNALGFTPAFLKKSVKSKKSTKSK